MRQFAALRLLLPQRRAQSAVVQPFMNEVDMSGRKTEGTELHHRNFLLGPLRLHEAGIRMSVGAQQYVADFMRQNMTQHCGNPVFLRADQPLDPIVENCDSLRAIAEGQCMCQGGG